MGCSQPPLPRALRTTLDGPAHFPACFLAGRSPFLVPPGCGDGIALQKLFQALQKKGAVGLFQERRGRGRLPWLAASAAGSPL